MGIYIYIQDGRIYVDVDEELSKAEIIGILEMAKHVVMTNQINDSEYLEEDLDPYNIDDEDDIDG